MYMCVCSWCWRVKLTSRSWNGSILGLSSSGLFFFVFFFPWAAFCTVNKKKKYIYASISCISYFSRPWKGELFFYVHGVERSSYHRDHRTALPLLTSLISHGRKGDFFFFYVSVPGAKRSDYNQGHLFHHLFLKVVQIFFFLCVRGAEGQAN